MEIAGLCLPLKPQKDSCSTGEAPSADNQLFMDGQIPFTKPSNSDAVAYKKVNAVYRGVREAWRIDADIGTNGTGRVYAFGSGIKVCCSF